MVILCASRLLACFRCRMGNNFIVGNANKRFVGEKEIERGEGTITIVNNGIRRVIITSA